jgi:putative Ig domain-containing protein/IPT/TIG domain-containing protein
MTNLFEWLKSHIWSVISLIVVVVIAIVVIVRQPSGVAPWVLGTVLLAIAIYFIGKIKSGGTAEDGAPMPPGDRRLLTGYLLLTGVIFVYMLVSLSSIDFPEPVVQPEQQPNPLASLTNRAVTPTVAQQPATSGAANRSAAGVPGPTPTPTPTPVPRPLLLAVFPHHTLGNKPDESLTLYGQNFSAESKVRFNNKPASSTFVTNNLLTAPLQPSHLDSVGSISVEVVNPGDVVSNSIAVPVTRPKAPLNVFFYWRPLITREIQLLLIVIFAGALGSYVHALKSLSDFIGNRTLTASWFWWYITRPFLGMSMALIFYAVLRGGFLAGTPADAKIISAFGVMTVGALVGMFADKAAQKLAEVFDVVFKAPDARGGKLDAPVIDKLTPDTVTVGTAGPVKVTIGGSRLGKVSGIRVNGDERKPESVSEKELTFMLRPEDMATEKTLAIEVVNPDGGVSASAKLFVSDLTITTAGLPAAQAGVAYAATIVATGGDAPRKWTLIEGPKWLRIADDGNLSGTPSAADVKAGINVTAKVVDNPGASATKSFTLDVA